MIVRRAIPRGKNEILPLQKNECAIKFNLQLVSKLVAK